ncbi:cystatin-A-like [Eleutherodactylus coqui]|uniref:cystatin-A-like n=1 Tax=Eleutherodactylus coqui TaxID=57060 RepID=UPI0034632912
MPKPGGLGELEDATPEVQQMCDQVKPEVEEQQRKKYTKFKALKYKTQMVAGTIHYVKVSVGNGKCIHLQILVPLDGPKPMLLGTQPEKTEDDEIEYFP